MSSEFNSGLQGTATGTAMNSVGLMYSGMASKSADGASSSQQPIRQPCVTGEVRWLSETDCFKPTQWTIDIAVTSIVLNIVLFLAVVLLAAIRKGAN